MTCPEYFSVAVLKGGGQAIRVVSAILKRITCWTSTKLPGLTRLQTAEARSGVITSPGFIESAPTEPARKVPKIAIPKALKRHMAASPSPGQTAEDQHRSDDRPPC